MQVDEKIQICLHFSIMAVAVKSNALANAISGQQNI